MVDEVLFLEGFWQIVTDTAEIPMNDLAHICSPRIRQSSGDCIHSIKRMTETLISGVSGVV